jgi:hypothetical protein
MDEGEKGGRRSISYEGACLPASKYQRAERWKPIEHLDLWTKSLILKKRQSKKVAGLRSQPA